jgi:hypothetical protein
MENPGEVLYCTCSVATNAGSTHLALIPQRDYCVRCKVGLKSSSLHLLKHYILADNKNGGGVRRAAVSTVDVQLGGLALQGLSLHCHCLCI